MASKGRSKRSQRPATTGARNGAGATVYRPSATGKGANEANATRDTTAGARPGAEKAAAPKTAAATPSGAKAASATSNVAKPAATSARMTASRERLQANVRANAQQRRRYQQRGWWQTRAASVGGALITVALVVGIILLVVSHNNASAGGAAPASVLKALDVSSDVSAKVGAGNVQDKLVAIPSSANGGTILRGPTGKPEVFYYGANWCPYCAAERWAVVVALSRFGTFQKLDYTSSSSTDSYPDTATFTFHGMQYTSQYVDFVALEYADRNQNPLDTPTAEQQQLITTYDSAQYFGSQNAGAIPFISIGNQYVTVSAGYAPIALQGLSQQEIANALKDPNSKVTKGIVGTANYLTAAICQTTNQQPASVCNDPTIQQIAKNLPKSQG